MANTINLKIKVGDDGSLRIVGKEADKTADKLDEVTKASKRASKSQKTLDRNLKGTANMTSNGTKQFSKMAQGMTGGLVPAYAVLASNVFALSAAFNFLKRAADVQLLEESQVKFAQNSGVALQSITQRLRDASDGMLGFQEAGQAAAIGLAKGFSPSQLEALAKGARKASTALGRDFQDSFDRLVRGASKAEPELLDELGITLRLEEATQKYADAIGKNRDELNSYQRSQAVLIETQRQLNKNFGDFEGATNPFIRLSKTFEDLIKQVTQFFLPLFTALADIINRSAIAAVAVFGAFALSIAKTIIPLEGFTEKIQEMRRASLKAFAVSRKELRAYINDFKAAGAAVIQTRGLGAKGVQAAAARMVAQGSDSKTLQKAAGGATLSGLDKANISKALKSAEAQYAQHGKIVTGIFKGRDIELVRSFATSMDQMNIKGISTFERIKTAGVASAKGIQVAFKGMRIAVTGSLLKIQKVAGKVAKGVQKVISIASGIGIGVMIFEMGKQIQENLFTIADSFAGVLDKIVEFVTPFADGIIRSFLGMIDKIRNGFTSLRNTVAETVNAIADGIRKNFIAAINFAIDAINATIDAANKIPVLNLDLPNLGRLPKGTKTEIMEVSTAVSTLAEDFGGLENSLGSVQKRFRESAKGQEMFKKQVETKTLNAQNEALKSYTELLEKGADDIDKIITGLESQDSALDKNKNAFKTLQSLDIPGLFAQITAETTEFSKTIDGQEKKTKRDVLSKEGQAIALERLKEAFSDLATISPVLGAALAKATLSSGEEMDKLGKQISNTAVQLAAFEEGLTSTASSVRENLKGGDFRAAFNALQGLKDSSEDAAEGITSLTERTEAAKDIRKRFKEMFGEETDADVLLRNLRNVITLEESLQRATIEGANATGIAATANNNFMAIQQEKLKIQKLEIELSTEAGKLRENEINQEKRLAEARIKSLEVQKELILLSKGEAFGAPKAIKLMAENFINLSIAAESVKDKMKKLREQFEAGIIKEDEFNARQFALEMEMAGNAIQAAAIHFKALSSLLKELGPDGQLLAGVAEGFANVLGSIGVAIESFAAHAGEDFAGLKFGIQAASAMLGGFMSLMNAQSAQAIAGIDKQIAAEQKRDGQSKKSQDRIKNLEKQKVAMQKQAFEMNKKMVMAQIVMQTALGMIAAATSGLGMGPFGIPLVPALMAMIAGIGAATLAMAASTSFQGGGSSINASPGASSISTGERRSSVDLARSQGAGGELAYFRGERGMGGPENFRPAFYGMKNRNYGGTTGFMVGEQGPELFVPERPGTIVPADETAAMGGPLNATINISAIDASGVEDILTEQQGNIIGMLREAANSYGEDFFESVDESIYTTPQARRA